MVSIFTPKKIVTYWLYLGILLVLTMVVIGGMTRLTHSGLSMVHWSVTGSLPPLNEVEWQAEFERYQSSPEFKEVHSHFTLKEFKSIFWWEYIHRFFGRLIGIVFIVPFVFFLWKRWIPRSLTPLFVAILLLGSFQAFLGWFMVKSGLVDVPRVSQFRLAAHLSTAFIACCFILWVALRYQFIHVSHVAVMRSQRTWATGLIAITFVQIVYGAFVAGLRAGWVHNTWPLMDGDIISPAVIALEPVFSNFFEGRSGVQFVHRTWGVLVLVATIVFAWKSRTWSSQFKKAALGIAGAVGVQFLLGVLALLFAVPIALGVLHQVVALIVLLAMVNFLFLSNYEITSTAVSEPNV